MYKMLELLEKRGPKAFDSFVLILKENFEWLADMLEREYSQRRQSPRQEESEFHVLAIKTFLPKFVMALELLSCKFVRTCSLFTYIFLSTQIHG